MFLLLELDCGSVACVKLFTTIIEGFGFFDVSGDWIGFMGINYEAGEYEKWQGVSSDEESLTINLFTGMVQDERRAGAD